jgi:hypothetical protein
MKNQQTRSQLLTRDRDTTRVDPGTLALRKEIENVSVANRGKGINDHLKVSEAHLRLQRLEELVSSLVTSANGHPTPSTRSPFQQNTDAPDTLNQGHVELSNLPGQMDVRGSEANYVGGTHWSTILGDIQDIKDFLAGGVDDDDVADEEVFMSREESEVIFKSCEPLTIAQAYNLLPPSHITGKLLSVFFSTRYLHVPFLHKAKFMREYTSFRNDPSSVPVLWVSILFSALHLGRWVCHVSGQTVPQWPLCMTENGFLTAASRLLVAGKYQKARPYSVEALLIHATCKFFQKDNPDAEPWILMAVTARLAMRMGYHRDSRHLKHISPFEGEMRRRTFHIIQAFDLLLSFQAGLPATIHEEECDTEPPANLFDEDFDEQCTILPPSRPAIDQTPMLYYRSKGCVQQVFRRIARYALSPRMPSYEEIMKLDAELHATHGVIPPSLRWKPLMEAITDDAHLILQRLGIELMYQKGLMMLHRNYISRERSNPAYAYSRTTCIDACLRALGYQADIHAATQVGGQLHHESWITTNLSLHDFLLASMIVCLDLYETTKHDGHSDTSVSKVETQRKEYDALKAVYDIWSSSETVSRDAKRAASVLEVMFAKLPKPAVIHSSTTNPTSTTGTRVVLDSHSASGINTDTLLPHQIFSQMLSERSGAETPGLSSEDGVYAMIEQPRFDWVSFVLAACLTSQY